MALTDKNIIITPNTGQTSDPTIVFSGADTSTSAQNISLKVYPISSGTLSFEGSSGQLFSISNKLSGTIFSVNDISGIPSIEVLDTGIIKLGQYGGNILLGTGSDDSNKLQVAGGISVSGNITVGGTVYANVIGTITTATSAATAYALANTSTTYVGRAVLADTATTATSAATAYALANTSTTYVGRSVLADTATTATSAATAYALANTSTTYVGRAVLADTATTATSAATAYSLVGGIGVATLTGSSGTSVSASTGAVTVWFNTATLVSSAISATTATSAATAYSLANTSTTYVGRAVLADTATTATSAATAYSLANTSTTYVGRANTATTATSAATAYALANTSTTYVGRAVLADTATTATSAATAYAFAGLLPIAQGGTNSSATPTAGGVGYGTGSAHSYTSAGTNGQIFVSSGTSVPVFQLFDMSIHAPDSSYKKLVRAATVGANITVASAAPNTLDGVTLALNDRILVKDQSTPAQNGIYYVSTLGTGANGVWTRSTDADVAGDIDGATVAVGEGTINGGKRFQTPFKTTDTVGTTAMYWNKLVDVFAGSSASVQTTAIGLDIATPTDPVTFATGAVTDLALNSFGSRTVSAVAASAYTRASTVYIAGAPVASTNATITTPYALYVAGGNTYLAGSLTVVGTLTGTASTATSAATAYSLANTSTTYVGRSVLADTATTATSAATAYALANTSTTYVGRAVLADTATTATSAATAYAVVGGTLNSTAYTSSFNGGLTASTTIASTTTYTTGGITLTSQTIATGSLWRIRAHGTFVAVSSGTARNAQIAAYWGTTALPVISVVVLTSTARTTSWELEFIIKGTSTSAGWTTGYFNNSITAALGTVSINSATPATTTVPTGAQTLDLRFSSSVGQIAGESWSVQNITIERLM